ncbi:hypothetical protein ACX8XO_15410 [Calditrichota bacterium LG24]
MPENNFFQQCSEFLAREKWIANEKKAPINEGWYSFDHWHKPLKRFRQQTCPNGQPAFETAGYNHFVPPGL